MNLSASDIASMLEKAYDPSCLPECPYPPNIINTSIQLKLQKAAVLLPLFNYEGKWHVLFIRRTQKITDRHSGQVAFPGGCWEPGDSDILHTALRETFEETGIKSQDVKILGRVQEMVTITMYCVTSIVGMIPWPYPMVLHPEEVNRIFSIPLDWLAYPDNRETRKIQDHSSGEIIPVIYFKPYDSEILWGASARITVLFLEALGLAGTQNRYR